MTAKLKQIISHVPRDFVTTPFFAAVKQTEPRTLQTGDGITWIIGADHPTKRRPSPALDMRHGRACFTLLSFRDRIQNGRDIHFSMNEFCHRYAASQGGRYSREILNTLYDLQDTYVRRLLPDGTIENFTIIDGIKSSEKPIRRRDALRAMAGQSELWLDRVALSPEFFGLLQEWEHLARIRLDVLTSLTSPTAQAIYSFLPSRAVYHTADEPFTIRLALLLEQVSLPVPAHKSQRKKTFTQNKNSILAQLDGKQVLKGVLRVALVETKDGSDYNLAAWVEQNKTPAAPAAPKSKLLDIWRARGRSKKDFDLRLKKRQPLSDYHIDMLNRARATLDGNQPFFEMAAALLGNNRFEQVLSEAKGDALEGDPGHNPTGRLIYRLMEALKG